MRWRSGRRSNNVIDRRSAGPARRFAGGGIGVILVIIIGMYLGVDPTLLLQGLQSASVPPTGNETPASAEDFANDPLADMVSVVMADTEDVWGGMFAAQGAAYAVPRLVLYRGSTPSACGMGQAAMGPFYCSRDENVYIDLDFYGELEERFGAPGDFAQAYVIAHEVGHHVQNLLGLSDKVRQLQERSSAADANRLSVRLELQADCLAGVWAHHAHNVTLEPGDVAEALNAASAIGDDTLQRQASGTVTPDSFTHGTSEQRQRWFRTGMQSGQIDRCDTFGTQAL